LGGKRRERKTWDPQVSKLVETVHCPHAAAINLASPVNQVFPTAPPALISCPKARPNLCYCMILRPQQKCKSTQSNQLNGAESLLRS
jgi:hypothetical protein